MSQSMTIAYFSMEVGLDPGMPTYSGGLGILAGDTLRAAADVGLPLVAVTLLHRQGYFRQTVDATGRQTESPMPWSPEQFLELLPQRVAVKVEGRTVHIQAWRYVVRGISGHGIPVYFLDTMVSDNTREDQELTDHLYGGDLRYRLCQEVILGIGGFAMLKALGHDVQTYHMNEGHSALIGIALFQQLTSEQQPPKLTPEIRDSIRRRCVFTTHTPVPAGHDQFPAALARSVLGDAAGDILASGCCLNGTLNMTYLALYFSHYVNGVAMRHGEISRTMFPEYPINSITNGVHGATWTAPSFQRLYDRHFPEWRRDNLYLRYAISVPLDEIQQAHAEAKRELLSDVERRVQVRLDHAALTLGFARRATPYKRPDLLFTDLERLRRMVRDGGPLQIIFAGKAHPADVEGKELIRKIFDAAAALGNEVRVVYLPEYDMALAKLLCAGVDVWLNTPFKPQEASGTSGMKAALNGVPSLSILDGWWVEGHLEGITGWSIGETDDGPSNPIHEATSLYAKLEHVIRPLYYRRPLEFAQVMRQTIALNGSFFNAQRMIVQYLQNAYLPLDRSSESWVSWTRP